MKNFKDRLSEFIYYIKTMFPVICVSILVLIMELIICYWVSLVHWTCGLFIGCAILAIDIYAWDNNRY